MSHVQRALGGMSVEIIRVPQLNRGVEVHHTLIMTPLNNIGGRNVPGQINENIARLQILAEDVVHIVIGDFGLDILNARTERVGNEMAEIRKIEDGQPGIVHLNIAQNQRLQGAGDRTTAQQKYPSSKRNCHGTPTLGGRCFVNN
jgi:hypothetical protein